jgi:hypothetical protein
MNKGASAFAMNGKSFHLVGNHPAIKASTVPTSIKTMKAEGNIEQDKVPFKWSQGCAFMRKEKDVVIVNCATNLIQSSM